MNVRSRNGMMTGWKKLNISCRVSGDLRRAGLLPCSYLARVAFPGASGRPLYGACWIRGLSQQDSFYALSSLVLRGVLLLQPQVEGRW